VSPSRWQPLPPSPRHCPGYEGELLAGIPTTYIGAETPSRVRCEVARGKRADIGRVMKRALAEAQPVSPSVAHKLGIATKPSRILYMRVEHRVVTSKPVVPLIR
jgi:hypothetical protein